MLDGDLRQPPQGPSALSAGPTDLECGHFGENFTVEGLPDDEVRIGDRYRIGEAEFEVTQPRVTCFRVGR
ncbi:MAG TPA: MOSC domain-containing protein [Pseudonocardiaceae bacterium]|nr:MOSC domain-containing protein [Pseudonocardiaceae bacterium]